MVLRIDYTWRMDTREEEITAQVDSLLSSQKRADGSSNADHAHRVKTLLMAALAETGESSEEDLVVFACAALGHDLLEDTDIDREILRSIVGGKTFSYIEQLTNTWGDHHTGPYVAQIVAAPEEVRLIKYADLSDNMFHASFQARLLGKEWMHNYFLPIVGPMRDALAQTSFTSYPKTAGILRSTTTFARAYLEESIKRI